MSAPDLRVDPHETLYVTDAEIIRRMGMTLTSAERNAIK